MGEIIQYIQPEIDRAHAVIKEKKLSAFKDLYTAIKSHTLTTPNTLGCFKAIEQSTERFCGKTHSVNQNYDTANLIHADDLLYLLYEKIVIEESVEHSSLLAIQLDEMISGLCPQGRTTRLLQVLVMLQDDLTPTSRTRVNSSNVNQRLISKRQIS